MLHPNSLTISAGTSICTFMPAQGGSLASWHVEGQPMLRTASLASMNAGDPLGMASFPLVPYSNRIGNATFEWAGERITLAKNFLPEPHALHGVGWIRPWVMEAKTIDSVRMSLMHSGDDAWPWPFEARQIIHISANHLQLDLWAKNLAPHSVPLAFGHHPYFDQAGASLQFAASKIWMSGQDNLPTAPQDIADMYDFKALSRVEGCSIDHCYTGVSGKAHIEWEGRALALDILSSLPAAVVYVPQGGDAFCLEPVPHVNNAINMPGVTPAMPVVATNGIFETSILLKARPK